MRRCTGGPSPGQCLFSVTAKGEVCVFDAIAAQNEEGATGDPKQEDAVYSEEVPCCQRPLPLVHPLENSFPPGSQLFFTVRVRPDASQFSINLCSGKLSSALETVVLHVNPRFPPVGQVVLNDKREGRWGEVEENQSMTVIMEDGSAVVAFQQGMSVQILIECKDKHFQVRILVVDRRRVSKINIGYSSYYTQIRGKF